MPGVDVDLVSTLAEPSTAPVGPAGGREPLAPFARLPVLAIAGATGAVLLAVSARYGYFGDELYFLASAKYHPAWGYADNPWLLPQLARVLDLVTPGSPVGLRLLPMMLTVAGVVIAALTAREFGGAARAQTIAAAAYASAPQLLWSGHLLLTSTVDPFCWTLVSWLVVRWLRARQDRLLVYAGLVTAVAMQGKFLIFMLWIGLVVGSLAVGPRALLRRPLLWLGGAITVVATLPTLAWQADHGWPYRLMSDVVSGEVGRGWGGRPAILPLALLTAGIFVGAFLAVHGYYCLLRAPELRDFRMIGCACVVVTALVIVSEGRYYYLSGLCAVLFAASAVRIERCRPARWWRWVPTWPAFALSAAVALCLTLPVRPGSAFTGSALLDSLPNGSVGWRELADATAAAYRGLPSDGRAHTAVIGDTYWQASALDIFGRADGLPGAYGPERGYWYEGAPSADTRQVLYVGGTDSELTRFFGSVRRVGAVRLAGVSDKAANQGVPIWLCDGPHAPWPRLWTEMHRL